MFSTYKMSDKIKNVTVKKATQKNKKLQAILEYESGKTKTIPFGAKNMSDFTLHGDNQRKQNYLKRHIHDPKTIDTAGFWARDLLWNKPTISESAKDIQRRTKIKVVVKV
jgi:hypothetical protein